MIRTPKTLQKAQVIWVSIGYCQFDPTSPTTTTKKLDYSPGPSTLENVGPPLETWKINFVWNKPLDFCKINEDKKKLTELFYEICMFQLTKLFAKTIFREKCFHLDFRLDRRKLTFTNGNDQGCGNTMPDLSDLVPFHSGQAENFYLLVRTRTNVLS